MRHNATHYSLPSFEILENAREFLFVWLKVGLLVDENAGGLSVMIYRVDPRKTTSIRTRKSDSSLP